MNPLADSVKVKDFLKQMVKVKDMHLERDTARNNLDKQIKKIKTSSNTKEQKKLKTELDKLYSAIQETLEKERAILHLQKEDNAETIELKDKIKELERRLISESVYEERLDYIADSLNKMHLELTKQGDEKKQRQKRMMELEGKIKNKLESDNEEFLLAEDRIKSLEKKYKLLLAKDKKANLNNVKKRLDLLKNKLEDMRL